MDGMSANLRPSEPSQGSPSRRYQAPSQFTAQALSSLVASSDRGELSEQQLSLIAGRRDACDVDVYAAGDLQLLKRRCVSIVGTREASEDGWRRAQRLARELAQAGIVVMSGLARGIDTAALGGSIDSGGDVIAVIGTPLDKAYPAENASLQEVIFRKHLLLSPFPSGERVYPSNFPKRNKVMAALSDATVIVEASDTSGTLHQAAECQRLGRWLFILRSVIDNPAVTWPKRFIGQPRTKIVDATRDVLQEIH